MAGFREYEPFEGNTAGPRAAQQRARCCCSLGPKVEAVIRRRTARGEIRKDLGREPGTRHNVHMDEHLAVERGAQLPPVLP